MRLIDADAAIEKIEEMARGDDLSPIMIMHAFAEFLRDTDETPTIVDTKNLYVDMRCLETLEDELDPIDEDRSEIHMRVDDIQRALYCAAQDLWILQGGTGIRMHREGEPSPVRLGSEANGCWIKCKDCANTRCSRRVLEDDADG